MTFSKTKTLDNLIIGGGDPRKKTRRALCGRYKEARNKKKTIAQEILNSNKWQLTLEAVKVWSGQKVLL